MRGPHGPLPAGHEHVHCHFCKANGVHVKPPADAVLRARGFVVYLAHDRKGATAVTCLPSRTMVVPDECRHQGDPQ